MTIEKFPHLDNNKPNVKEILNTPVDLVDDEHLGALWNHFSNIRDKYSTDKEIYKASTDIINRINNIINFWKWNSKISWEIMRAANDENYSNQVAV